MDQERLPFYTTCEVEIHTLQESLEDSEMAGAGYWQFLGDRPVEHYTALQVYF